MPGSVMPIAPSSSPRAILGQPLSLLLLAAVFVDVVGDDPAVDTQSHARSRRHILGPPVPRSRARTCRHRRRIPRGSSTAAGRVRRLCATHPGRRGAGVPTLRVGHDLTLEESASEIGDGLDLFVVPGRCVVDHLVLSAGETCRVLRPHGRQRRHYPPGMAIPGAGSAVGECSCVAANQPAYAVALRRLWRVVRSISAQYRSRRISCHRFGSVRSGERRPLADGY